MKISRFQLQEIVYDVAQQQYGGGIFQRQNLMKAVEAYLRTTGGWMEEDDRPDRGARGKSTGFGGIDWAVTAMKRNGALVSEGWNQWRVGKRPASEYCGILLKVSFGEATGLFPGEYISNLLDWAASGESWNTKIRYAALDGGGKKILLYDPQTKGVTVEFEVSRVERTGSEENFPWSNFIVPNSVEVYPEAIPIEYLVQVPGLASFQGRPAMMNLKVEQYHSLKSYQPMRQARIEGIYKEGLEVFRQRDSQIMNRRKERDRYTCQVCGFRLRVGRSYIIDCHHRNPIHQGERETTMDDLVCLCPTCHRIAHVGGREPLPLEKIREIRRQTDEKVIGTPCQQRRG